MVVSGQCRGFPDSGVSDTHVLLYHYVKKTN